MTTTQRALFTYSVRTVEVEYNPTSGPDIRARLDQPHAAAAWLQEWYRHDRNQPDREHFVVLGLDGRHRFISAETLSTGTSNQAPVDAAAVFRHGLLCGAHGLILAHNHPSGDLDPSRDDFELTRRLVRGGQVVGIPVLDHILIEPGGRWISLRSTRSDLFSG